MAIASPSTYGEWYWAQQVEANKANALASETELSETASKLMTDLHIRQILPFEFADLFSTIASPKKAFLGEIGGRFVSEVADGAVTQGASPFYDALRYKAYDLSPTKKMSPVSTATLFSRGKIKEDLFFSRFRMEGYEPLEAKFQYDALRAYPSILDIMKWARYQGDPNNIRLKVWEKFDVDFADFDMWEWMSLEKLSTDQVLTLYKREVISQSDCLKGLSQLGWTPDLHDSLWEFAYSIPNAMLLVQGGLMQGLDNDVILRNISKADIHPDYAKVYLDAILTKPASTDIIAYQLRHDPELSNLEPELVKIGIHPAYAALYKELAYQIPPVADIITMAVREAFTPSIAERFGQYEDFPEEFGKYAGMKGLSDEWCKRYWAAHWSLPSPQQGFEMLHRGVIDGDELEMLLRALDVMPFWRDKLTRIAFNPLTRVDVRRMYATGILTEAEVYESYLEQGYDEKNAERLANFTVKATLDTLSKFTSTDIVSAFVKRMIDENEARSLLRTIGIKDEEASYIISTAEYKRLWAFTDDQIAGIKNLYKKHVYDENDARGKLAQLNLPAAQIDVLMQQWLTEARVELTQTWTTAQVLSFLKNKLINPERAARELRLNGFDDEHIEIYLRSVK